tara:strand:- start:900 stop:1277 length:378 start_codon:yes stop_codon:yes gene_type:complete
MLTTGVHVALQNLQRMQTREWALVTFVLHSSKVVSNTNLVVFNMFLMYAKYSGLDVWTLPVHQHPDFPVVMNVDNDGLPRKPQSWQTTSRCVKTPLWATTVFQSSNDLIPVALYFEVFWIARNRW